MKLTIYIERHRNPITGEYELGPAWIRSTEPVEDYAIFIDTDTDATDEGSVLHGPYSANIHPSHQDDPQNIELTIAAWAVLLSDDDKNWTPGNQGW